MKSMNYEILHNPELTCSSFFSLASSSLVQSSASLRPPRSHLSQLTSGSVCVDTWLTSGHVTIAGAARHVSSVKMVSGEAELSRRKMLVISSRLFLSIMIEVEKPPRMSRSVKESHVPGKNIVRKNLDRGL